MDLADRINSCRRFRDGICPHGEERKGAYLTPPLLKAEGLRNTTPSVGPASRAPRRKMRLATKVKGMVAWSELVVIGW
jgi:hypothetical protein